MNAAQIIQFIVSLVLVSTILHSHKLSQISLRTQPPASTCFPPPECDSPLRPLGPPYKAPCHAA